MGGGALHSQRMVSYEWICVCEDDPAQAFKHPDVSERVAQMYGLI
jgi:hypothetical protein